MRRAGVFENDIADLESGTLSFRRFEPDGDPTIEVQDRLGLDLRHQGEYVYHIVGNLVVNPLKMRTGLNQWWDESALRPDWLEYLPDPTPWLPFYEGLRAMKVARDDDFPADTLPRTRGFLEAFQASLDRRLDAAFRLRLVRHARNRLNDCTFLGTGRDPSLAACGRRIDPHAGDFDVVYPVSLSRAVETARALAPGASIQIDARLDEINYGHAEGLTVEELGHRFPAVVGAWKRGEDAPFPGGEGTDDVLQRTRAFLGALARDWVAGSR